MGCLRLATVSSAVRGSATPIFQMPTAMSVSSWLLEFGEVGISIEGQQTADDFAATSVLAAWCLIVLVRQAPPARKA